MTRLDYRFTAREGSVEAYPEFLTDFFLDRPLEIYGRVPADHTHAAVRITGTADGKNHDMVFTMDLSEAAPGPDTIQTKWAWNKVYHLIGEHTRSDDDQVLDEIQQLAAEFGIRVPYGSDLVPMGF